MFKNKEIKKLITIEVIAIFLIIVISFILSDYLNKKLEEQFTTNNSYIIGSILAANPELEDDIVFGIFSKENKELGNKILNKYHLFDMNLKGDIVRNNIIIVILVATTLLVINFIFVKVIYKRITKIDKYMNNILNNDYSLNIKDYCEGDISNLKNNTYKMTVKLKEQSELLLQEKKYLEELLEDISHQIKTPLTSMYMINDILINEEKKEVREQFLIKNEQQIKRIEWLITSLLKISRLDSGTIKLKKETVSLVYLINKAILPINDLIKLKNIDLVLNLTDCNLILDLNWTSEAILNIVKNACEHTKDKIVIDTFINPIYIEIKIIDNGNGIDDKDLSHIFERFYRGTQSNDSIGIGLNMSKKIINLQNGIIEVESFKDKGTTFIIKIFKNII